MTERRDIPQCSPLAGYLEQAEAIDAAMRRVMTGGRYILGPEVTAFEQEFATFVGTRHALGVANGTDALVIALKAMGIGPGDAVVSVSNSAVATTVAIRATGATPLFVDVDPDHGLMDIAQAGELLALAARGGIGVALERIKAILPVHLYGRCVDMDALCALANQYRLPIVEDCAQAHGAQWNGRAAGTFGQIACFSFYPTKNLGAAGDGGAVATSDPHLHERARLLREYGWRQRYVSDIEGGNSRLDELQAALLRVKLTRLAQHNEARARIAMIYRERIRHPAISIAAAASDGGHVYHQFVVRTQRRDALHEYLKGHGIGTLVHYPCAIHQQPAYADPLYRPLPLERTERWTAEVLSLPMFPQLARADAEHVADTINAWDVGR
jgi:dTDP-4-amino-4,6-dideoxygalactose transaminase